MLSAETGKRRAFKIINGLVIKFALDLWVSLVFKFKARETRDFIECNCKLLLEDWIGCE